MAKDRLETHSIVELMKNPEITEINHHHARGVLRTLRAWTMQLPERYIPMIDTIRALKIAVGEARNITELSALHLIRLVVEREIEREVGKQQFGKRPIGWKQIGEELGMSASGALRRYSDTAQKFRTVAPNAPAK